MPNQGEVGFLATRSVTQKAINITASGVNSTTGWTNDLSFTSDGKVKFTQIAPIGMILMIQIPFCVSLLIPDTGQTEIEITHPNGTTTVSVADSNQEQSMCINSWLSESPATFHQSDTLVSNVALSIVSSCIEVTLGHFDLPAGCATWDNPFRSKRYTFHVRICGPTEAQAQSALEECLRTAAISALLAAVLVPIGWSAAWGSFKTALTGCLIGKLGRSASVSLWHTEHCV